MVKHDKCFANTGRALLPNKLHRLKVESVDFESHLNHEYVFTYRTRHCPECTFSLSIYLSELATLLNFIFFAVHCRSWSSWNGRPMVAV